MDNSKAMAIFVKYSQGQNYTPAEAMSRWTEENFGKFHMDFYKGSYIRVMDCDYYYDHWKIEKQSDGMELVTLYLKSEEAKEEKTMTIRELDILKEIANLCEIASTTIYDDETTAEILNACDTLMDLIDDYIEKTDG